MFLKASVHLLFLNNDLSPGLLSFVSSVFTATQIHSYRGGKVLLLLVYLFVVVLGSRCQVSTAFADNISHSTFTMPTQCDRFPL